MNNILRIKILTRMKAVIYIRLWESNFFLLLNMTNHEIGVDLASDINLENTITLYHPYLSTHFTGGSDGKKSVCSEGDLRLISGSGRSPGEEYGKPLQFSCLENPVGRGA